MALLINDRYSRDLEMTPRQVQKLYDKSQKRIFADRPLRRTLPPRPKRTAIMYLCLPVGNQERERTHCPLQLQPHLSRTNWRLELVVPSHRSQDLTRQCKVVVYPRSALHRALNPARARKRESELQDKIAATVTVTMGPRAANRSGVERNNPSNAWDGVFKVAHTHTHVWR
jgi:hypothetical protein